MDAAAQLRLATIPAPDLGDVVEVVTSYLQGEAEVPLRLSVLVRLNAGPLPLAEPLTATALETGEDVPQAEIEQMWANRGFRVAVTRDAYSAAVRRRRGK